MQKQAIVVTFKLRRLNDIDLFKIKIYLEKVAKSLEPPEFNHDWRDGLPIAQVPFSVAEINKDAGYHKLKIIVGAFSHESYTSEQFQAEVDNAVMAAKDAENSFPGSISGISIHFNVLTMQTEEHVRLVQRSMTSARGYTKTGGKVGVRLEECDLAFKELYNRSEESLVKYGVNLCSMAVG